MSAKPGIFRTARHAIAVFVAAVVVCMLLGVVVVGLGYLLLALL